MGQTVLGLKGRPVVTMSHNQPASSSEPLSVAQAGKHTRHWPGQQRHVDMLWTVLDPSALHTTLQPTLTFHPLTTLPDPPVRKQSLAGQALDQPRQAGTDRALLRGQACHFLVLEPQSLGFPGEGHRVGAGG